jgi:crotonobetaine/carnitine-CoA ligase
MEFVDSLPYTPTNKVQKFKLREQGVSPTSWDLKQSNYRVKR